MSMGSPLNMLESSWKISLPNLASTGVRREYCEYRSYSEGTSAYGLGRCVRIGRSKPRSEAEGLFGRRGIRRVACCGYCCIVLCWKSGVEGESDGFRGERMLPDIPPSMLPALDIPNGVLEEPSSP